MLLDSHILNKSAVINHLGIPRWHKRISYYIFKIKTIQRHNTKLNLNLSYAYYKKLN